MSDKGNDACDGKNGAFVFLDQKGPLKPTKGLLQTGEKGFKGSKKGK